jgi:cytochrome b subunit of formate dehydrogenase
MKRLASLLLVVLLLSAFALVKFAGAVTAQTPQTQSPQVNAQTQGGAAKSITPNPSAVAPNPSDSVAAQTGEKPAARRRLQCQGCHGPGKTLPYLGGSLFHTDEHAAYDAGFHAKAIQGGHRAATCLDCHTKDGRGDMTTMLPKGDPASPVNRANLANTCGRCHGDPRVMQGSGITDRPFLSYRESVHAQSVARGNTGAAVCSDCHRAHDILPASDPRSPIFKFNVPQTCGQCHPGIASEFAASVHGQAAAREGRRWVFDILPRRKDVADVWQNFLYYAGLREARPKIARFGYAEKAEYWAVIWGTIVMGLTGLMIWFKLGAFGFLPRWWIDIAIAVHFYEAVLATLAIVVWHFYHVVFDPDVYPVNFAFYDGRVSEELFKEEHELAYEQMKEAGEAEVKEGRPGSSDSGGRIGRRPIEQGGD